MQAYLDKELNLPVTAALIQTSEDALIPNFIDITPGVIKYGNNNNKTLTLSNFSSTSSTISPKQFKPVSITESKKCSTN